MYHIKNEMLRWLIVSFKPAAIFIILIFSASLQMGNGWMHSPVQTAYASITANTALIADNTNTKDNERYDAATPQLGWLLEKWSPEDSITTSIKDAYPIVPWLADIDSVAKPLIGKSLDLAPGYYRFAVESYCLHAGTYGPTQGDGYLLAPLKGNRAQLIRSILQRAAQYPKISQQDVQRLIWAIEAGANFLRFSEDFQERVKPLLTPQEITAMSVDISEAKSLLDRFLPSGVRKLMNFYQDFRQKITDAQTTFQELEQVAVRTGAAPMGKGSRNITAGNWNYAGDGFYVRTFPQGYQTTVMEVVRPAPYRLERDVKGRIIVFESGDYRIETNYDDSPGMNVVSAAGKPDLHIWRFKTVKLTGPKRGQTLTVKNTGWILASDTISFTSRRNFPKLTLSNPTSDQRRVGNTFIGRKTLFSQDKLPTWEEAYDRATNLKEKWDQVEKYEKYRDMAKRATQPPSEDAIRDITDLGHYEDGLESAKTPGDIQGRSEWIADHAIRVRNAWNYANCVLAGECEAPGTPADKDKKHDKEKPQPEKSGSGKDESKWFEPTGNVASPGNTNQQRLGLSARTKPSTKTPSTKTPCQWSSDENRCDCIKHVVTHIEQFDPNSCWREAFMMAFGRYPKISANLLELNGKLKDDTKSMKRFAADNGLNLYEQRSWTADQLREFLLTGPIYVGGSYQDLVTGEWYGHVVVIGGVEEDCDTGEVFIDVYNPQYPVNEGGVNNLNYYVYMQQDPCSTFYILTKK